MLNHFRLFQLISPSLPIGGFTYSQGLEWAVDVNWVACEKDLLHWLDTNLKLSLATLELPLLKRLYIELHHNTLDHQSIYDWSELLYTSRETSELRAEEIQKGKALFVLLKQLNLPIHDSWQPIDKPNYPCQNQLLGFCVAAKAWDISLLQLQQGYLWTWLENNVTAAIKLIPLGQTSGQKVLLEASKQFECIIKKSNAIKDEAIGSFTPAVAIASSRHETLYTRLFRS